MVKSDDSASPETASFTRRSVVTSLNRAVGHYLNSSVLNGILAIFAIRSLPRDVDRILGELGDEVAMNPEEADPEAKLEELTDVLNQWREFRRFQQ